MNAKDILRPFSKEIYQERRRRLAKALRKSRGDFVALFWSGSLVRRNANNEYPFRANSDFLYLTGFSEPDTLLVIESVGDRFSDSLGLRPRDLSTAHGSEVWDGERVGVERAPSWIGTHRAFSIHEMSQELRKLFLKHTHLYWRTGVYPLDDQRLEDLVRESRTARRGISGIRVVEDPSTILHEMRRIKSRAEIEIMRQSAEIAAHGHIRAMEFVRPGQFEYQIEAEVEREFKRRGALAVSYSPIVATGNNACTLHYRDNRSRVQEGDLLLMDAGAEFEGYASDITRCFPASGKFSEAQRDIYTWVLKAQKAAIQQVRVGRPWNAPHLKATEVLVEGLRSLGILKAPKKKILEEKLYSPYFPHGTSHWLGMDVHDCGLYYDKKMKPMKLRPGNVLTIEPGLYFRKDDKRVPARYRGIGVRIEDDVAVTARGPDVLTKSCPKEIHEIEKLRLPRL